MRPALSRAMRRRGAASAGLLLLAAVLPGGAHAQVQAKGMDQRWHVGSFHGELRGDNEKTLVAITCESSTVCKYTLKFSTAGATPRSQHGGGNVEAVDPAIANNNLEHTRDAVRADAGLYGGREGPLLEPLRALLEGPTKYRRCVGIDEPSGEWGQLCQLDSPGPSLPEVVLLLPTMNATCGSQPFCAYFVVPLHRQGG